MEIRILGEQTTKRLDAFELLFLHGYGQTFLPDLYDVFLEMSSKVIEDNKKGGKGDPKEVARVMMLRFLDIFAGTTIDVPRADSLRNCIRDVDIFVTLSASRDQSNVRALSEKYDLQEKTVVNLFERVKDVMTSVNKVQVLPSDNE